MIPQIPILIGDRIRFESDCCLWRIQDRDWLRIPEGTEAEVVEWQKFENPTKYQQNPCALRIKGMKHPEFNDFPLETTFPGMPMPSNLNLIERKK